MNRDQRAVMGLLGLAGLVFVALGVWWQFGGNYALIVVGAALFWIVAVRD